MLTIALIAALSVATGVLGGLLWQSRRFPVLQRRVLVNTDDPDVALRGVLVATVGDFLVLDGAEAVTADAAPVRLDGRLYVERRRVRFFQALP